MRFQNIIGRVALSALRSRECLRFVTGKAVDSKNFQIGRPGIDPCRTDNESVPFTRNSTVQWTISFFILLFLGETKMKMAARSSAHEKGTSAGEKKHITETHRASNKVHTVAPINPKDREQRCPFRRGKYTHVNGAGLPVTLLIYP